MKYLKASIFISLLMLLIPISAFAEDVPNAHEKLADIQACKAVSIEAAKLFNDNKYLSAVTELSKYSINTDKVDLDRSAKSLEDQISSVLPYLGGNIGSEYASASGFGDSFMLINCINKYEKGFIRWEFAFYKPKDKWVVANLRLDYNTDLQKMIDTINPSLWSKLKTAENDK